MGKQICPDERLFTEATAGGGRVDVDLEAGDSPLDLAFDDASADVATATAGLDLDLESSDQRPAAKKPAAKPAARRVADDDLLDIGSRTAAGLEAALFAAYGGRRRPHEPRPHGGQPCGHAGIADDRAPRKNGLGHGRRRYGAVLLGRCADRRDADDREPGCQVVLDDQVEDGRDAAAQRIAHGRAARARLRDERVHGGDRSRRPRARRQGPRRFAGRPRRPADGRVR